MRPARERPPTRTSRSGALLGATAVAALLATGLTPPVHAAADSTEQAVTVRPDPSYQQQSFQGWGTALAWFANVTGGWPDAQRNALADALYGADGLGFTIARYNIGGGDSPETAPYMRPGAAVPGWWNRPGPEAPDWWDPNNPTHWNPNADANQRWWLTAAKARGATTFEAFSNSAPYFMTNSGLASGATNGWQDNLRSDQYDRFAAYLSGALQRAQSATGVTFDSLSPTNEPGTDYWHAGGRQEGSHWDPASQARMVTTMRARLNADGITTPLAAMDETNPDVFRSNWDTYDPAVKSAIGRLNTHTYGTSGRTGVRDIAKGAATPLWMSEVDLGGSVGQSFTDMSPALDLTQHLNEDFRELEPRAWVLWQAVEDYENMTPGRENSNWGLIQADFTPADAATEPLRKNKKYWAMANYTRFVRPGARVINTDNADTFAALRPAGQGAVVVHTNPTGAPQRLTLNLAGFQNVGTGAVQRYTTDGTKNVQRESDLTPAGKTLTATVGAGSVTTFVLPGATGVNVFDSTAPTGAARQLLNDDSGKALAVSTSNGQSTLVQRTSSPGAAAQQWRFTKLATADWGNTATYRITSVTNGKALAAQGDVLALVTSGTSAEQSWMLSTTGEGHYTLVNSASGRLLDVSGQSTSDGAPVGAYRPTTGANQSWTFRSVAADTWTPLRMRHSGKCLDVTGASTADGAQVVQYACGGATNQQWSLRPAGVGYVNVVARHSGKCLDVTNESTADGAIVFQYGCNGGSNQQWSVHRSADGFITLLARHSGKCLDVSGASTANGADVVQYTCGTAANQQLTTS
ncbi:MULTISPECIES: RICIN domain-containing protein [unclassified Streptomyces]|uniref:RICIN domain-containing protein n=1 Tax=unclassified Streptomyces TaxID=2593676 RepID=UPI002E790E6C|nr:RICIN domain-containing protein [Streptomyces sp. SP18ES09]MEE1816708.1 RICIN domain-containing protein [Streptomyces sp. SP18ES09]